MPFISVVGFSLHGSAQTTEADEEPKSVDMTAGNSKLLQIARVTPLALFYHSQRRGYEPNCPGAIVLSVS